MKTFRHLASFAVRLLGFILSLPSAILYTISDLIKNKNDEFNF